MSQNVSSSYSTLQSIDGATLVRAAPVKGFQFNAYLAVVLRDCDMKCVLSSGDLRLLHGFQIMREREEGKGREEDRGETKQTQRMKQRKVKTGALHIRKKQELL